MQLSSSGAGGDVARLEGPMRLVVPYSGVGVAAGVATQGGVYDAWFRAGGTRALLYAAARCSIAVISLFLIGCSLGL